MNLRKFLRVPLCASAVFSWADQKGLSQQGKGKTRDLSAAGAFLYTDSAPPVGSTVQLEMRVPFLRGAISALRMKAKARVVRVQPPDENDEVQTSGFAVITDSFILQDADGKSEKAEGESFQRAP